MRRSRWQARRGAVGVGETQTIERYVAALRSVQRELAASERKYRRLFQESRDAILVVAQGVIADANPAAGTLLGYGTHELRGLALADLLVDPDETAVTGRAGVREVRAKLRRRDGEPIHVWIIARGPGLDDRGDALIIRDLTSTLSLERQVQQAQKMEAVGRLASGIAHDFNNLLTAITGYTDLLICNLSVTDQRLLEDAYAIQSAARSAARLTKQLLEFSRPQRTGTDVLDVNAIVTRTAGVLRRTLGEDIQVTLALDPDAKPVKADASQIEQIVLNLAINARDAMPHGGRLTLTTAMHVCGDDSTGLLRPGDYVRLIVADTGCGMPDEIQSHVFEPFFTTKGSAGIGLGLATVYGIVTQSGGHVRVESTVGIGSTFTVDLPASSEVLIADETATLPCFVNGSASVLIVEDDPGVRQIAELVLRRAGHEVVSVAGPQDALAALRDRPGVDLVLTDVVMPEMNGYDLAAEIRKTAPSARVVFMSGFARDPIRQPGDNSFLAKPFTAESLTNAVQQAMAAAW